MQTIWNKNLSPLYACVFAAKAEVLVPSAVSAADAASPCWWRQAYLLPESAGAAAVLSWSVAAVFAGAAGGVGVLVL